MIAIERDPVEPPGLAALRADRLAGARVAASAGLPIAFAGYDLVKPDLFRMQRNKCCYCEKLEEQAKYRDVEHYRPKSLYWWLTWTWENLLFACIDCNREHKRNQFPVADEKSRLIAEQPPPGSEQPLVLDPCDTGADPATEIEFRPERIQGKERWKPYGLTPRGRETIDVCGLDRPGLLDFYRRHVICVVRPKIAAFFTAQERGDARDIVAAWSASQRALLGSAAEFRALSHDAIAVIVPRAIRERYRLPLSRPSR